MLAVIYHIAVTASEGAEQLSPAVVPSAPPVSDWATGAQLL